MGPILVWQYKLQSAFMHVVMHVPYQRAWQSGHKNPIGPEGHWTHVMTPNAPLAKHNIT